MRKFTVVLLLLILTSVNFGQSTSPVQLYLGGGIALPSAPDDFKDYWNMGFNGIGGAGIRLNDATSVFLTIGYGAFPLNEDKILKDAGIPAGVNTSIDGGTATGLSIEGSARLLLITQPKSISPYLVAGIGYFSLSITDVTVRASYMGGSATQTMGFENESALSTSFGAGLDIPISTSTSVFIEATYFIAFTEDENTSIIPINVGVLIGL